MDGMDFPIIVMYVVLGVVVTLFFGISSFIDDSEKEKATKNETSNKEEFSKDKVENKTN